MILTYRYRLKDGIKRKDLKILSGNVNFVWNFANEAIRRRWKESRKYTSKGDLNPLIKGSSKLLQVNSQTIQATAYECLKRTQKARKHIRFRTGKKNLGWIPFNGQTIKFHGGYIDYSGYRFRLWKHRKLPEGAVIKSGSFSEDSRGRWYINLQCEIPDEVWNQDPAPDSDVGIDPGLKTIMTTTDKEKFDRKNITKAYAGKLAKAQRHNKKKRVKAIHAKIKNTRLDWNHKKTTELASRYKLICFGNASSGKLGKTRMSKGIYDAGWHQLKTFLSYKTMRRGGMLMLINERNTTVTCSDCLEKTGPRGLSGLDIREWTCSSCKAVHDRDHCSSKNILRLGHETLSLACGGRSKGSPALMGGEDVT